MTAEIKDPDVRMLAAISGTLSTDYAQAGESWMGSPFAWIKLHSSRRRGKIGKQLVSGFLAAKGFDVARVKGSSADRLVNGCREIKFSTLWKTGAYKFQQIRDQDYTILICLGISPFDAHCWAIPRSALRRPLSGFVGQRTGSAGKDTAWLSVNPATVHDWLSPYGGRLPDAMDSLKKCARPGSGHSA
jgi:hypothetical protein